MQKKNIYIVAIIILLIIVANSVYFIFTKPSKNNSSQTQQTNNSQDTIRLAKIKSLEVLTDSNGATLYHNIQDFPKNTKPPYSPYSKCNDACSVTWPPFYTDSIKISAPLKADDFTVFTRTDGKKQIAWRGWPLYYYTGDTKPGDVNGQNVESIWYAGIAPE